MVRANARSVSATCRLATPASGRSVGCPGIESVAQATNARTTITAALEIIAFLLGLSHSKVAGLGRGGLPVVVAAIHVLDRCLREFFIRRVVQASDVDRVSRHCLLAASRKPRKTKSAPDACERP